MASQLCKEALLNHEAPAQQIHWARRRAAAVWCLDAGLSLYGEGSRPHLQKERQKEAHYLMKGFLRMYAYLAQVCLVKRTAWYKLRPKHHYFDHLLDECEFNLLNPIQMANFSDEDHMKYMKSVAAGCHAAAQSRTWARRWIVKKTFQWKRLTRYRTPAAK